METPIETSIFLARVIGLFCVISALAIMVRYKAFLKIEQEASQNRLVTHLSGFSILIIGLLMVVSHSLWVFGWRLVITLLGWIITIKGVLRIFSPELAMILIAKKQNNRFFILGEIVFFFVGAYLLYYGFVVY